MPDNAPSAEQVRAALDELLGWQGISRSPQVAELLRYVVEKRLSGDEASIKAYSIAVDVFGRPQSFDPQADPIVRVQARRLRTLLGQFYDSGQSRAPVRISLPLGRYVPEFVAVGDISAGESEPSPAADGVVAPRRKRRVRPFLMSALLGLFFTLVGVGLAVVIIRWTLGGALLVPQLQTPEQPRIGVAAFDNLTGDAKYDAAVAQFGPHLGTALSRFDAITVVTDSNLMLGGSVQITGGEFQIKAMLSQRNSNGVVWSTSVTIPAGTYAEAALAIAATELAAQLGNASGPLHAPGRLWLAQQAKLPEAPSLYVCELQFMAWRDTGRLEDATRGEACFEELLKRDTNSAVALASDAALTAWRVQYEAGPGEDLAGRLAEPLARMSRALELGSQSSFVYEQQGQILARAGSIEAALSALRKARALNPANIDATALDGLLAWLDGKFAEGRALAEEALTATPSPPPWYHTTRAFDALREKRYFDAMEAAQALSAGDDEIGPAIALATAPQIGRSDLVERYKPLVLGNARFQATGIMPRLAVSIREPDLLKRIGDGLALAGIPVSVRERPFNADGSARN